MRCGLERVIRLKTDVNMNGLLSHTYVLASTRSDINLCAVALRLDILSKLEAAAQACRSSPLSCRVRSGGGGSADFI